MTGIIKERLFTPGPTPLLLEAQLRALTMTLHHRTDAFRALMRETLDNLRYYFNTRNDVILFASSGTGAMEASITNCFLRSMKPKRALCAFSKARFIAESAPAFTVNAESVPA